jgi:hypothetical protein
VTSLDDELDAELVARYEAALAELADLEIACIDRIRRHDQFVGERDLLDPVDVAAVLLEWPAYCTAQISAYRRQLALVAEAVDLARLHSSLGGPA